MNNAPNQNQDNHFQSSDDLLPHLSAYKDENNNTSIEKVQQSLSHMGLAPSEEQIRQAAAELESKGLVSYNSQSREIKLLDKASEDRQKTNQAFLTDVVEKTETLKSSYIPEEGIIEEENEEVKEEFELTSRKILDLLNKRLASHSKQKLVKAIQKVTGKKGKSAGTYITIMLKRRDISRSETGKYFILKDGKEVIKKPTKKIVSKVEPKLEVKTNPIGLPSDIIDLKELETYSNQLEQKVTSLEQELRATKQLLEKVNTTKKVWGINKI